MCRYEYAVIYAVENLSEISIDMGLIEPSFRTDQKNANA